MKGFSRWPAQYIHWQSKASLEIDFQGNGIH